MLNFWPAICMVSLCSVCDLLGFRLLLRWQRSQAARQGSRAARWGACAVQSLLTRVVVLPSNETQGTTGLAAAGASLTLERLFAVPTDAYTNAYGEAGVDMRPAVPVSNLGGVIKLALPTLALSETASSLGAAPAVRAKASARSGLLQEPGSHKMAMGARWISMASVGNDGAVAARTQSLSRSAALTASALASVDHHSGLAKAVAQARLKRKHNLLAAMKREHTDASDAGPSQHGRNSGKKGLDGQISGSGKWLAKAVMWLAIVAGTCILGGICAVIYCYRSLLCCQPLFTCIHTRFIMLYTPILNIPILTPGGMCVTFAAVSTLQ